MKRLHKRQKLIGKQTISQTSKLPSPPNHNNEATHLPRSTFCANCLHSALLSTLSLIFNNLRGAYKPTFYMHYRLHSTLLSALSTLSAQLHPHRCSTHPYRYGITTLGGRKNCRRDRKTALPTFAIRSPYDVKKHCRLQRVQTAVHIKIRLIYTLFIIDYQLLLHTKCRVQTKQ